MATTASWLSLSLVVVLILVPGLVVSSVSVSVACIRVVCTIRVGGVGAVATIRSVVAITLVIITITVSLVVVITLGMFVLVVGVTMRLTMCLPLLGIAIVIVASACVPRHDDRVAIDLVLKALNRDHSK